MSCTSCGSCNCKACRPKGTTGPTGSTGATGPGTGATGPTGGAGPTGAGISGGGFLKFSGTLPSDDEGTNYLSDSAGDTSGPELYASATAINYPIPIARTLQNMAASVVSSLQAGDTITFELLVDGVLVPGSTISFVGTGIQPPPQTSTFSVLVNPPSVINVKVTTNTAFDNVVSAMIGTS